MKESLFVDKHTKSSVSWCRRVDKMTKRLFPEFLGVKLSAKVWNSFLRHFLACFFSAHNIKSRLSRLLSMETLFEKLF